MKIGKSNNPEKRVKELQTGNAEKLEIIATYDVPDHYERLLQKTFFRWRKRGEWFNVSGSDLGDLLRICDRICLRSSYFRIDT